MSNEALLLQYLRSIEDSVKRIENAVGNQDSRIDNIEQSHANLRGQATAAGAIITALSGFVAWIVSVWKH